MDQFLAQFGLEHLKEQLRNEGIEDPNFFEHLLEGDITKFINRQDKARVSQNVRELTLGETANLRKAWEEVKKNGWEATATASSKEPEGICTTPLICAHPNAEMQQSTTTGDVSARQLARMSQEELAPTVMREERKRRRDQILDQQQSRETSVLNPRMQPIMLGCSLCRSPLGTLGGSLDLEAHRCSAAVPQLGERQEDPKKFKLEMICPVIHCTSTIAVFSKGRKRFCDLKKHVSKQHMGGPADIKVENQLRELFGLFLRLRGIGKRPKSSARKRKGSNHSANLEDVKQHAKVAPAVAQAGQSSKSPEMPTSDSLSCGPPGDSTNDFQEFLNTLVYGKEITFDESSESLLSNGVSPNAGREQKTQKASATPDIKLKISECLAPIFHKERSALSRRRQLVRFTPIRRFPLHRILQRDKNGKSATKWLTYSRFGSRIFETRKRTLSPRSSTSKATKKKRHRKKKMKKRMA